MDSRLSATNMAKSIALFESLICKSDSSKSKPIARFSCGDMDFCLGGRERRKCDNNKENSKTLLPVGPVKIQALGKVGADKI